MLLAIDEEQVSEEAVAEVAGRKWGEATIVRVLHGVGRFVPPAQELWCDAGKDLELARQEIKDQALEQAGAVASRLRVPGLQANTTYKRVNLARPSLRRPRSGALI